MKRFYIILILSLSSVNAYALVFDKCYDIKEKTQFDSELLEKYQYEFFLADGKIRRVYIFTDNGLKKRKLEAPSVSYEKIFTKIFDVTFIDENYIEAINIEDTKDRKISQKLILYKKNGKISRNYKVIMKNDNLEFINKSFEENCEIVDSTLKSSPGNSSGTFKNILGKYLGK